MFGTRTEVAEPTPTEKVEQLRAELHDLDGACSNLAAKVLREGALTNVTYREKIAIDRRRAEVLSELASLKSPQPQMASVAQ